jgi:hypothetical protein
LIPSDIKWDPNGTPPQFTNNEDTVIEPSTHVRVKIIGTRTEVGEMWAIGSIKEDYLGYVVQADSGGSVWKRTQADTLPDASRMDSKLRQLAWFMIRKVLNSSADAGSHMLGYA